MFHLVKVLISVLSISIVTYSAQADTFCTGDKVELQMLNSGGSYKIRVKDLLGAELMSVDSLKAQFPGMEDSFYEEMAQAANQHDMGYRDLGACGEMDTCQFNDWSSDVLASCNRTLEESTAQFELVKDGDSLKIRCTQNGTFDVSNSLIEGVANGKSTQTIDVGLKLTDCGSQSGTFDGVSSAN